MTPRSLPGIPLVAEWGLPVSDGTARREIGTQATRTALRPPPCPERRLIRSLAEWTPSRLAPAGFRRWKSGRHGAIPGWVMDSEEEGEPPSVELKRDN